MNRIALLSVCILFIFNASFGQNMNTNTNISYTATVNLSQFYKNNLDYVLLSQVSPYLSDIQKQDLFDYHYEDKSQITKAVLLNIIPTLGSWITGNPKDALTSIGIFATATIPFMGGYLAELNGEEDVSLHYTAGYVSLGIAYIANILIPIFYSRDRNAKLTESLGLDSKTLTMKTNNEIYISLLNIKY